MSNRGANDTHCGVTRVSDGRTPQLARFRTLAREIERV